MIHEYACPVVQYREQGEPQEQQSIAEHEDASLGLLHSPLLPHPNPSFASRSLTCAMPDVPESVNSESISPETEKLEDGPPKTESKPELETDETSTPVSVDHDSAVPSTAPSTVSETFEALGAAKQDVLIQSASVVQDGKVDSVSPGSEHLSNVEETAPSNVSETFEASPSALGSAKQDVLIQPASVVQDAKVDSVSPGSEHPFGFEHLSNVEGTAPSNVSETFEVSPSALVSAKQDVLIQSASVVQDAKVDSVLPGSEHPLGFECLSNVEGTAPSNVSETLEASPSALGSAKQDALIQSASVVQDAKVDSVSPGSEHPFGFEHLSNVSKPNSNFVPFPSNEASKCPSWLNRTSFMLDNTMVSSVEGETVLIVENLNLCQPQRKDDEELPGTGVSSMFHEPKKETAVDASVEVSALVGKKIRKKFGRKYFDGDVLEYDREQNWYKVVYEDGDVEELDGKEVKRLLVHSDDAMEDHSYEKKRHRRSTNSVKRSAKKSKKDALEVSEDGIRGRKGSRKSVVIDTSNDDSDVEHSASSNQTSDANDEPEAAKHPFSLKKLKGRSRGKRRKMEVESDSEKEYSGNHSRVGNKHRDDAYSKLQDTPAEYRVSTRRTGSLSTNRVASDSITSAKLKDSLMQDGSTFELSSPLAGGLKLIGRKTQKDFGGELYVGEIIDYDDKAKYYKVRYEDGDEEELEWSELEPTLLPNEENEQIFPLEGPSHTETELSRRKIWKISTTKHQQGVINVYEGEQINGDLPATARRWRKKVRTASMSIMAKGVNDWDAASPASDFHPAPRPLAVARFASASDADAFEYFGWGEIVNFERSKCPEVRATRLLPTSSPVVHLAVSRHHIAALTAAGQVWIWRCKHGNIHSRCNEWEHISMLDGKNIILVDISGPDVDRASAGYQAEQEDQVPDPFYLAAVCSNGEDIIIQGSQAHESVHAKLYEHQNQYPSLQEAFLRSHSDSSEYVGSIVQLSVGTVEAADESPFIGYITDADAVYIRSATRDYMEEVNVVTGYTGKPVKIQCGRVYHAIIMTDDGRAWTWGQGYYHGSNSISAGFPNKWASPFSLCQPAVGTLVGRKVIDVGCYGEDFIALTNDGDVHYWTHARPNPAAGVYNVPATAVDGQGPCIASGDKLKQVTIGAGVCAGIAQSGKVHTWRTSMKGGFVGIVGSEQESLTPLGHEEGFKDTLIFPLATRIATKIVCVAGSLLVIVKRRTRGRRGWKKKSVKGVEVHRKITTS